MSSVVNQVIENVGKIPAIVCSFDTTGSMLPAIQAVRSKLKELAEKLFQDIPNLKMGLIAHGDYCDGANCITTLDLTDDIEKIMNFINNTPNTSGGDEPECYELALHEATKFSWPEEGGILVLIGDASPHSPNKSDFNNGHSTYISECEHDWKEENQKLLQKNVKVIALQCLKNNAGYNTHINAFWEQVSEVNQTPLLCLDDFKAAATVLGGVAAATAGAEAFDRYMCYNATGIDELKSADLENLTKIKSYTERK